MRRPKLPPRLDLCRRDTPLQPLERLSAQLGGPRLWVKRDDLTESGLSGNKVRKLEFALAEALDQGCDTIVTCGGVQSNHCRATALACARLGLKCHLVLRGEDSPAPDGNLFLDHLAGATCHFLSPADFNTERAAGFPTVITAIERRGGRPFYIPMGASDAIGAWGYIATCLELANDFKAAGITPGLIVTATGSGGTQTGLTLGCALMGINAEVVGFNVCDDAATFEASIRADMRAWREEYNQKLDVDALTVQLVDGYVGPGYAIGYPAVYQTIREVARLEGLLLDPVYTGKAMHGLMTELKAGRWADVRHVVFILTGGMFGLMAQRAAVLG